MQLLSQILAVDTLSSFENGAVRPETDRYANDQDCAAGDEKPDRIRVNNTKHSLWRIMSILHIVWVDIP